MIHPFKKSFRIVSTSTKSFTSSLIAYLEISERVYTFMDKSSLHYIIIGLRYALATSYATTQMTCKLWKQ